MKWYVTTICLLIIIVYLLVVRNNEVDPNRTVSLESIKGPSFITTGEVANFYLVNELGVVPYLRENTEACSIRGIWLISKYGKEDNVDYVEDLDTNEYSTALRFLVAGDYEIWCKIGGDTKKITVLDSTIIFWDGTDPPETDDECPY